MDQQDVECVQRKKKFVSLSHSMKDLIQDFCQIQIAFFLTPKQEEEEEEASID